MLRALALAGAACAGLHSPAAGQLPATARALGMGGAYVATARGYESLFVNPANLGLGGTPYWSISIPQVVLSGGTEGPTPRETWDLFQASGEPPERRAQLLARVPEEGMRFELDARVPVFSFQSRRLALGVAYGAVVDHSLGRDLVELFVNGYESGRSDYEVGNTTGSRATFFDFAAGYGTRVGPLAVGVTGHYLLGRSLTRAKLFDPEIDPQQNTIAIEYREVLARGGHGYAVDLGAALEPLPGLTLSAAVTNAFGEMRWSEELHTRVMIITQDDFGASSLHWEGRFTEFWRDSEPVPAEPADHVRETAADLYRDAGFPATLRTGVAYRAPAAGTQLEAAYHARLGAGRLGGGWERMLAAGVQQGFGLLSVRAGAATDLDAGSLVSGGLTLGPIELGLARVREERDTGVTSERWIGTFGLSIRTRSQLP